MNILTEIPAEYRVRCVNYDNPVECDNYADTRTGGDMNPYGSVQYKCDSCIDADAVGYYG